MRKFQHSLTLTSESMTCFGLERTSALLQYLRLVLLVVSECDWRRFVSLARPVKDDLVPRVQRLGDGCLGGDLVMICHNDNITRAWRYQFPVTLSRGLVEMVAA